MTATLLIDKYEKKKLIAKKGSKVTVYNQEHGDVWLCEYKGNKFSMHKDNLKVTDQTGR